MPANNLLRGLLSPNTSGQYALQFGIMAAAVGLTMGASLPGILLISGASVGLGYVIPKIADSGFGMRISDMVSAFTEKTGISEWARNRYGLEELKKTDLTIAFERLERGNVDLDTVLERLKYATPEDVLEAWPKASRIYQIPEAQQQQLESLAKQYQAAAEPSQAATPASSGTASLGALPSQPFPGIHPNNGRER